MKEQVFNKLEFNQTFAINEIKHIADAVREAANDTVWNANRFDINLRKLAMYFSEAYRNTNNQVYDTVAYMLNMFAKCPLWDGKNAQEYPHLLNGLADDIQCVHDRAVSELGEEA